MKLRWAAVAAALAILIGGAITAFALKASTSSSLSPANRLVCHHFLAQRHWYTHLTYPNLADAAKLTGYIAADSAAANGNLKADLSAIAAGMETIWDNPSSTRAAAVSAADKAAAARVMRDC